MTECILDLPENWHALHLGGTDYPGTKSKYYSPNLLKCQYTTGAFGILFNNTVLDLLIDTLSEEKREVDIYYAQLMKNLNWFRTREKLLLHQAGFSEINNKFVDYKHLR